MSKGQEEARTTELHGMKESTTKWKKEANMFQQKCKNLEERLQEVGASALICIQVIHMIHSPVFFIFIIGRDELGEDA